tara:strand:- start:111 stop:440 length:330 start_codon:yes stop_codon:yes gene_type:complete
MLNVTDEAAKKIEEILQLREDKKIVKGLRVGVRGGGCSGFSYFLKFENNTNSSDKIITCNNIKLIVDSKSYLYLMGTEIDYVNDLNKSGFKFNNPNAKRTCGCGESFSV